MIGNILSTMFAWPQGIVVGNLIASFLIWFPHFIYIGLSHKKLHSRLDAIERKMVHRMPYEIRSVDGNGYEVVNKDTGDVKAKHATREDAERQVRLLHAIENDPNWEAKHNA